MFPVRKLAGVMIVYLRGRIDYHEGMQVEKFLVELVRDNPGRSLLLNLAETEYISSSGVRIFITLEKILRNTQLRLLLSDLPASVKALFDAAKLTARFEIFRKEEEALDAVS